MDAIAERRRRFLLFAGLQFVVLTTGAMALYAGGTPYDAAADHYQFFHNFLSDLGSTETFAGRTNYPSCVLFALALATLGAAIVGFAGTWTAFAFALRRGRVLGAASRVLGTASGLAFVGIAVTPWNLVVTTHMVFVFLAFGLLLAYVACMTLLLWRNGSDRVLLAASVLYIVALVCYIVLGVAGPTMDSARGHAVQVTGQKLVCYASMAYLIALAMRLRRRTELGPAGTMS
jgi:hypothetical membrane protein